MMRDLSIKENSEGYFLQSEQKRGLTATDPRGLKGGSCLENFFLFVFLFDLFRSGREKPGAKQGLGSLFLPPFYSFVGQVKETLIRVAPLHREIDR